MRDVKAKVGFSYFFSNSPCLYLMLICYCLQSPNGESEVMSHLLPILLILFFFSLGSHSSCIFIRMPLPICSSLCLSCSQYGNFCLVWRLLYKITPQRFCGHIGHYSHSKYMSGYKITVLQNVYVLLITQFQYTQIQDQGKLVLMIS